MPNLLVIGAMKAGTTTICEELASHPQIFFPEGKEPNCLARHEMGEKTALVDYRNLYCRRFEKILGDGSTGNSKVPFRPDVSGLAASLLGHDIRIIYVKRDPIERIERHLAHDLGNGQITAVMPALFQRLEYLAVSAYDMQLSYWRRHFPGLVILEVTLEEYLADRETVMRRIFAHLGLDAANVIASGSISANRGTERRSAHLSPLRWVLHTRAYRKFREFLPRSLRRPLAEALLPRAHQIRINLTSSQRAAIVSTLAELNALDAPRAGEIARVIASAESKFR